MNGVKGILLMAGIGRRFDEPIPKQFHLLGGKPLYLHTLDKFLSSNLFEEVILVCPINWQKQVEKEVGPTTKVIKGGATRRESSYQGLLAAGPKTEIVVIHDAVRPFITEQILKENIEEARRYGAVNTCIPSTDTLVYAPTGKKINAIPKRSNYLRGQTPQSFEYPLILEAHEKAPSFDASDDCQLVIALGKEVHIVAGDETNIKITSQKDLYLAEFLLKAEEKHPLKGQTSIL